MLGAGLNVSVGAGLALVAASAPTADDSDSQWVELETAETVTLAAADPVNPRWDVIEIAAADALELSSLRDIFNPAIGTFTPQTLEKRRGSDPTLYATAGTPAAVPTFPAGTAGRIPLAYVYVPANAVTLTLGDEVGCRPLAAGLGSGFEVQGGGVGTDTTAAANANLRAASGRFEGAQARWSIAGGSTSVLSTTTLLGAALPGADSWVYFYAAPPPYPAGYDSTLAAREFEPGTNAATRFSISPDGVRGCIVVADTVAPDDVATRQGAPASVSGALSSSVLGFGAAAVTADDLVYLGAAYLDVSASELGPQVSQGEDTFMVTGSGFALASNWPPNEQVTSGSLTTYDASTYGTSGLPDTADRLLHFEAHVEGSGSAVTRLTVADELHGDTTYRFEVTASVFDSESGLLLADDSRQWRMSRANVSGSDDPRMRIAGFRDAVLANR